MSVAGRFHLLYRCLFHYFKDADMSAGSMSSHGDIFDNNLVSGSATSPAVQDCQVQVVSLLTWHYYSYVKCFVFDRKQYFPGIIRPIIYARLQAVYYVSKCNQSRFFQNLKLLSAILPFSCQQIRINV